MSNSMLYWNYNERKGNNERARDTNNNKTKLLGQTMGSTARGREVSVARESHGLLASYGQNTNGG